MLMTITKEKQHKENLMNCWEAKELPHSMPISSQASFEEGSTTIPQGSTTQACWKRETPKSLGDDIVSSAWKHAAVHKRTVQKEKNIKCAVYGLYSTEDEIIRYVGQTTQPLNRRLHQHLADSKRADYRCSRWIRKVMRSGYEVKIVAIEEDCTIDEAEKAWISYYKRITPNLTNTCEGGNSSAIGVRRSEETIVKMMVPKSEKHKANMRKPKSVVTRANMSLAQIGNTKSRGESNRHAKLSEADVKTIRALLDDNMSLSGIGSLFGLQKSAISKIKTGRTWAHI